MGRKLELEQDCVCVCASFGTPSTEWGAATHGHHIARVCTLSHTHTSSPHARQSTDDTRLRSPHPNTHHHTHHHTHPTPTHTLHACNPLQRFSSFEALHATLKKKFPRTNVPALNKPKKKKGNSLEPNYLRNKQTCLSTFLDSLLSIPEIAASPELTDLLGEEGRKAAKAAAGDGAPSAIGFLLKDHGMQQHTVKAKQNFQRQIEVSESGSYVVWEFTTVKLDIAFSATFEGEEVVRYRRYSSMTDPVKGSYTVDAPGILTLSWDNSYSKMRNKKLKYRTAVVDQTTALAACREATDQARRLSVLPPRGKGGQAGAGGGAVDKTVLQSFGEDGFASGNGGDGSGGGEEGGVDIPDGKGGWMREGGGGGGGGGSASNPFTGGGSGGSGSGGSVGGGLTFMDIAAGASVGSGSSSSLESGGSGGDGDGYMVVAGDGAMRQASGDGDGDGGGDGGGDGDGDGDGDGNDGSNGISNGVVDGSGSVGSGSGASLNSFPRGADEDTGSGGGKEKGHHGEGGGALGAPGDALVPGVGNTMHGGMNGGVAEDGGSGIRMSLRRAESVAVRLQDEARVAMFKQDDMESRIKTLEEECTQLRSSTSTAERSYEAEHALSTSREEELQSLRAQVEQLNGSRAGLERRAARLEVAESTAAESRAETGRLSDQVRYLYYSAVIKRHSN